MQKKGNKYGIHRVLEPEGVVPQPALRLDNDLSEIYDNEIEMGAVMMSKNLGKVYFFSMATSFTKAALGAEGIGKDVEMIIGNGYCAGHAELTLNVMRQSAYLRDLYTKRYLGLQSR